jgi:hypothetical protein
LTQRLEETFEFQQRLWRFDVLEEEALRAQAVRDAVDADIVIVAMKDDSEVPEAVRRWLESLLRRNSGATALVALLDRPGAPVQPYLEDVARRGGMDFFAQSGTASLPLRLPRSTPLPAHSVSSRTISEDPHRIAAVHSACRLAFGTDCV